MKKRAQPSARGGVARLGLGLLLALGGCNWILNLDEAAPTADAAPPGAGATDASMDTVAFSDVAGEPMGNERDATAAPDVSNGVDASMADARADADGSALPPILACASKQVTGTGTPLATGTTVGGTNSFAGTCGMGTSNDVAFDWIVPATDYYAVSTAGSSFDTVLYLRDGACDGAELACNDNVGTSPQSEIVAHFNQGQRVLAVVDGKVGDQGTVAFNAERVTCPALDLTGQPLPAMLSTVGGTNTHTGACGGANQLERTYRFTPPTTGLYSITVKSTDFPPILYVEQGPRCGGALLGCNKGNATANSYPAEVVRNLTAGQPVTITVDGGSGFFTLNATRIIDDAGTCGSAPLPAAGVMVSLPAYGASHSTGSCVLAGGLDGVGSGPYAFTDVTYNFPVNLGTSVSCTYTIDATNPFTLYLIQNACSGSETQCKTAVAGGSLAFQASFSLGAAANGMYTLVVENGGFFNLTFTISVACIA